jgi:cytochrome c-type biogenesis protein CcmH/NrfG
MPDEGTQSWFQQGIVLPQHKRQLILAHAEARKARRMPHKWVYLMGVVASCLVVMTGWWFTVGSWIQGQLTYASQPGIQQEVQQQIGRLEEAYPIAKPSLADAKSVLNPLTASAATTTIDKTSSR